MKKYQAVIFDLDGTLLNTLEDLADSTNYALRQMNYPERTIDEVRRFVGNGVEKLMERAVPTGTSEDDTLKALAIFKKHNDKEWEHEGWKSEIDSYEGVIDVLKVLKEKGIPAGIVSNKFDAAVKGLRDQFFGEYIYTAIGESANVAKKPAPDTCIEAMKEMQIGREGTVYVGDSDVDIMTAKNSGLECISVTWGFRDEEFLLEHGATQIIHKPEELLEFF